MKKYKNLFKRTFLTALALSIVIASCNEEFLEVPPTGSLSDIELSTKAGVEGSLIASYSMLLGRAGFYSDASNWFWGSVLGGDAYKGTNQGDQSQVNEVMAYATQTNNVSVLEKYQTLYEGIARANTTLRLAAAATDIAATDMARIVGEAKFLRAYYYFELKKIFNDTPYVDENWDGVEPIPNNVNLWTFIEADLQDAFNQLPETQGDAGRANKWAAGAFLGKAYLFQGKYDEARTLLTQVIDQGMTTNGQTYALLANYGDNFRGSQDNNSESIFAAQAAVNTGTINNANPSLVLNFPHGTAGPDRPGGCCGFFQPSFDLVNSFRTDGSGLPLLDGSYNSDPIESDMGLESSDAFTPDAGNIDPRLDHSVGRRSIPYLDWGPHPGKFWIRDQDYGGPYSPKKFIYYKDGADNLFDGSSWTPGYTAVNYSIMRFADLLLLAAEAEIEASTPDLTQALDYINMLRTRASNSPVKNPDDTDAANYVVNDYTSFASVAEARAALRMERKLELSGEGHRFYDLVRWGIVVDEINDYLTHEDDMLVSSPFIGATFNANKDEYLPIPQNEIDLIGSDILQQNAGY